ncbi:uncharacterized protein V6R79_013125 [Siganus canaliculatus]
MPDMNHHINVTAPEQRHAAIITIRNTAAAIAVVWAFSSLNVLIRVILLLEFPFSELESLQMTNFCSDIAMLIGPKSDVYDKIFTCFIFIPAAVTVVSSYVGVTVAARSASTNKASALKARKTLLLHLVQLGLSLLSTMHAPIVVLLSRTLQILVIKQASCWIKPVTLVVGHRQVVNRGHTDEQWTITNEKMSDMNHYINVTAPEQRHAAIITIRNTAAAIAVVWAFSSLNVLIRVILLLEFPFSDLQSLQMTKACSDVGLAVPDIVILPTEISPQYCFCEIDEQEVSLVKLKVELVVLIRLTYPVCGVITMLSVLSNVISPLTLVVMSLERYVAVCFPLRHAAIITIRNTAAAIAVVWAFSSLNVLIRVILLLEFPFSELQSLQMTDYCSDITMLIGPKSDVYNKIFTCFVFISAAVTVSSSYVGVTVAARSASTDKASALKARKTLLLHLVQLGLSLLSTMHAPIVVLLSRTLQILVIKRIKSFLYIFVFILPRCLSSLVYGLRDQTIRPVLLYHLCCRLSDPSRGRGSLKLHFIAVLTE